MNFHKSKIDWCTHTWSPVTGCLHGCEYCYARRLIGRFQPHIPERPMPDEDTGATGLLNETDAPGCYVITRAVKLMDETGAFIRTTPYPKGFSPTFHAYTLGYPAQHIAPCRVFVSSIGDLFGKWVPDKWIEAVFDACREAPQHTYLFLTKNPDRYCELANAGKLPKEENFWYGTTVTHKGASFFGDGIHYNTFLSIEPLMEDLEAGIGSFGGARWIIVGAMTGPGSKEHQPRREWVENIVETARLTHAAVFMKGNLAGAWGPDLIQEYPEGMAIDPPGRPPIPHCKECGHASRLQQGRRGISYACHIGWDEEDHDDGGRDRHIPGQYTRTSPPWCPLRKEAET